MNKDPGAGKRGGGGAVITKKSENVNIYISDGSNNLNRDTNACLLTTATAMLFLFNNRAYLKKNVYKIKFILPMLKFEL